MSSWHATTSAVSALVQPSRISDDSPRKLPSSSLATEATEAMLEFLEIAVSDIYLIKTSWLVNPAHFWAPHRQLLVVLWHNRFQLINESLHKTMSRKRALELVVVQRLSSRVPNGPESNYNSCELLMLEPLHHFN